MSMSPQARLSIRASALSRWAASNWCRSLLLFISLLRTQDRQRRRQSALVVLHCVKTVRDGRIDRRATTEDAADTTGLRAAGPAAEASILAAAYQRLAAERADRQCR